MICGKSNTVDHFRNELLRFEVLRKALGSKLTLDQAKINETFDRLSLNRIEDWTEALGAYANILRRMAKDKSKSLSFEKQLDATHLPGVDVLDFEISTFHVFHRQDFYYRLSFGAKPWEKSVHLWRVYSRKARDISSSATLSGNQAAIAVLGRTYIWLEGHEKSFGEHIGSPQEVSRDITEAAGNWLSKQGYSDALVKHWLDTYWVTIFERSEAENR